MIQNNLTKGYSLPDYCSPMAAIIPDLEDTRRAISKLRNGTPRNEVLGNSGHSLAIHTLHNRLRDAHDYASVKVSSGRIPRREDGFDDEAYFVVRSLMRRTKRLDPRLSHSGRDEALIEYTEQLFPVLDKILRPGMKLTIEELAGAESLLLPFPSMN
jgi:hypothetical protein